MCMYVINSIRGKTQLVHWHENKKLEAPINPTAPFYDQKIIIILTLYSETYLKGINSASMEASIMILDVCVSK